MTAAAMLSTPHWSGTLGTIGVLAATGMRVGEAIRRDRSDVDFAGRTVGHPRRQVLQ
jgi:integrase